MILPDDPLLALSARLGYVFRDPRLLEAALTHKSWVNEQSRPVAPFTGETLGAGGFSETDNQRLEFVGDAVIGAAIGHLVFDQHPEAREGALTRYKAVLVSETGLADVARDLDVGAAMRLGRGEERSGGRSRPSVLADALEAVIAAVYLDGGFDAAAGVVRRLFGDRVSGVRQVERHVDFKTKLQEFAQARVRSVPTYRLVAEGSEQMRRYRAEVWIGGHCVGDGEGKSKKEAEQTAARAAFDALSRDLSEAGVTAAAPTSPEPDTEPRVSPRL